MSRLFYGDRLSPHRIVDTNGQLICLDVPIARTGKQDYLAKEIGVDDSNDIIAVDRPYDEVFSKETLASFENAPVTLQHPKKDVKVGDNYKQLAVGFTKNVRQGKLGDNDVILADLVIYDEDVKQQIIDNKINEVSCGYDCNITDSKDGYCQTQIRGNHVAIVEAGRAGIAKIADSTINDEIDFNYYKKRIDEGYDILISKYSIDESNLKEMIEMIPNGKRVLKNTNEASIKRFIDSYFRNYYNTTLSGATQFIAGAFSDLMIKRFSKEISKDEYNKVSNYADKVGLKFQQEITKQMTKVINSIKGKLQDSAINDDINEIKKDIFGDFDSFKGMYNNQDTLDMLKEQLALYTNNRNKIYKDLEKQEVNELKSYAKEQYERVKKMLVKDSKYMVKYKDRQFIVKATDEKSAVTKVLNTIK